MPVFPILKIKIVTDFCLHDFHILYLFILIHFWNITEKVSSFSKMYDNMYMLNIKNVKCTNPGLSSCKNVRVYVRKKRLTKYCRKCLKTYLCSDQVLAKYVASANPSNTQSSLAAKISKRNFWRILDGT